ncbi:uncharacterized protein L201_007918 [Kwoniella dendrophila CBS 6074]|uniref:SCP domain-containing protein n=1 Tax=Kwoniella dendrophila CBS 6074 TaxID=1295534 RepID=A0AAX4K7X6_9TREE
MLNLSTAVLFSTLASLASVSVSALPHCHPHHHGYNATTVTQWYTQLPAQETIIPSAPSSSLSASEVIPTNVADNSTSVIIDDPSSVSVTASSTNVEVVPSASATASSSSDEAEEPTEVETSVQVDAATTSPVNLAARPTRSATRSTSTAKTSTAASAATSTAAAGGSGVGTPNTSVNIKDMVKLHTDFRAQYGAGAVTWSDELANYATSKASACKFAHTGGQYGENLAAGAGGGYNVASAFNSWAAEASEYDPSNPTYSHFTQVVWKATTQIGCAAISCPDGTIFSGMGGTPSLYVMCEYNPPGNYVGQYAQNVGSKSG